MPQGALVDELARCGVRHACICPGSRSTPLALTLASHEAIRTWVHIDERSAAFFALGLAKASGTPVALVCTSGTAAANFLPAVVEARYGRVPLVVLTADRPPELRENGAPQAIDQIHLYGRNVKWFMDLALPEAGTAALRYVRTTAARAVATAVEAPAGPVHLNLPFREPLAPAGPVAPTRGDPPARSGTRPYAALVAGRREAPRDAVAALARTCAATARGLIVCGPQTDPELAQAVTRLAAATGYPVLADPLSGVRCGAHERDLVVDSYDAFLRDERAAALTPELVLRFGAPPTSKALNTFLRDAPRQVVDRRGLERPHGAGRADAARRRSVAVRGAGRRACGTRPHAGHGVDGPLAGGQPPHAPGHRRLYGADRRAVRGQGVRRAGRRSCRTALRCTSGTACPCATWIPSSPLASGAVRILGNRGANGIDGVVSSALGAAAAAGGPLVLAIGDLSFYHDMNGLLAARRHGLDATIVLLNNDGGGIFSFLPQAAVPDHFEELFGTPTGLDFRHAAALYGCDLMQPATWPQFRAGRRGQPHGARRADRASCAPTARATWRCTARSGRPSRRPYGASKPRRHRAQRRGERRRPAAAGAARLHRQRRHLGRARALRSRGSRALSPWT